MKSKEIKSLPLKNADKKQFYFEHVKRLLESNLGRVDYCKKHGVRLATLMYWRKKYLANKEKEPIPDNPFTQIRIKELPESNLTTARKPCLDSLTIILPNGIELLFPVATENQRITNLIQSLWGAIC
jgi:hypothetical protein